MSRPRSSSRIRLIWRQASCNDAYPMSSCRAVACPLQWQRSLRLAFSKCAMRERKRESKCPLFQSTPCILPSSHMISDWGIMLPCKYYSPSSRPQATMFKNNYAFLVVWTQPLTLCLHDRHTGLGLVKAQCLSCGYCLQRGDNGSSTETHYMQINVMSSMSIAGSHGPLGHLLPNHSPHWWEGIFLCKWLSYLWCWIQN